MKRHLDSETYYSATKKYDLSFPRLTDDIEADVVIIGGGFTGVNTALELAEKGFTNTVILEGRYLGYGGTGRNGGQIMAGLGHDLDTVKKHVGPEGLQELFKIGNLGAAIIKERAEKYDIKADFRHGYAYLGSNPRQEKTLRAWEKEFKSVSSDTEIELLTGSDVKSVVGSDAYSCALKHMGAGHVHSLNLLLGEAKVVTELYGVKIYENSMVISVEYGDTITVRTPTGSVKAKKLLWACNGFLEGMEPELHKKTINTHAFQMATEPLSDELIEQISPIRGAYSDIRPVIDYYRVTNENRLLFGAATRAVEHIPSDLKNWNRDQMLKIFPYLDQVKVDYAWGGPLCVSASLFPQMGTLKGHDNVFYVQGYSGFGVTPSHIICKVLAEGMTERTERYDLISGIPHVTIHGKDYIAPALLTGGKMWHQISGYWNGRR